MTARFRIAHCRTKPAIGGLSYPYLQDGMLDPVWAHKAESGTMSATEYKAEYETGYRTTVERITIEGDKVTSYEKSTPLAGHYSYVGKEILTDKKGNQSVRFIFKKTEGVAAAPGYIQFSDHRIAPFKTDHCRLYWGNDRAGLLEDVANWPTYYPSSLSAEEIMNEMKVHRARLCHSLSRPATRPGAFLSHI